MIPIDPDPLTSPLPSGVRWPTPVTMCARMCDLAPAGPTGIGADPEPQPEAAEADPDGDIADLEERESIIHSKNEDAGSECSRAPSAAEEVAAPAAARGRGKGRGRGRGRGQRGRGRGGAKGRGSAAASGEEAAADGAKTPAKYKWVDVDQHDFTLRQAFDGEPLPTLPARFDGLGVESQPWEWFKRIDAPISMAFVTASESKGHHTCARTWTQAQASARLRA